MVDRDETDVSVDTSDAGTVDMFVCDAQRRSRDASRVQWVSLSPLLFVGLCLPVGLVVANSRTVIGDAVAWWMLLGVFSLVVFIPLAVVGSLGASALRRARPWLGRWLGSIGATAAILTYASFVFSVVETVVAPEIRDPNSWGPVLTPGAAALVVLPYAIGVAANTSVLVRLWRRTGTFTDRVHDGTRGAAP